jgi:hypothetical protein
MAAPRAVFIEGVEAAKVLVTGSYKSVLLIGELKLFTVGRVADRELGSARAARAA